MEQLVIGQFLKRETFVFQMLVALGAVLVFVLLFWLFNVNALILAFLLVTGLLALVPLGIYLYNHYSIKMEVYKLVNNTFEVSIEGGGVHILNPHAVYFGIDFKDSGQKVLKLGVPDEQNGKFIVLSELLPNHLNLSNVEKFAIPPGMGKETEFLSNQTYPGDLSSIVSLLGFV